MKKAFTLIELMIVIAVVGTLMSVLIVSVSGATEGARSAKCKSHMRNLAQAVQSYAIASTRYPNAGSYQYTNTGTSSSGKIALYFHQAHGWIGWNENSKGKYHDTQGTGNGPISSSFNSSFSDNQHSPDHGAQYAITNGTLWRLVHDLGSYTCPEHVRLCRKNNVEPMWSYVMNAYFGYDWTRSQRSASTAWWRHDYGKLGQATDRTLLFAEIPAVDIGAGDVFVRSVSNGDTQGDCTLQFETDMNAKMADGKTKKCNTSEWKGTEEVIGFNHVTAKKHVAHVVFADSHVEEIMLPKTVNMGRLRALTANLCNGIQVTLTKGEWLDPDGRAD